MPRLASEALLCDTEKLEAWDRTQASNESLILSPTPPFYTNWVLACKTETLGYFYSHTLLI